jgi:hypothetical protein
MDPIASQILDLPPSCIEFLPADDEQLVYFIVGTYNLQKENIPEEIGDSGAARSVRIR